MRFSYLRELTVLARYLNFSLAANHLHMTQSGLSRHIATLEKKIGIKLFERNTHKVTLTEQGEEFLRGTHKILDDYDFLCESVSKGGLQKITIGFVNFNFERYLSHIMSLFESAHPGVKTNYLPAYPDAILSGLLSKQVDVAILPRINVPISKDLVFQDVDNESVVLMLNRSHPLSTRTGVRIAELEGEKFITLEGQFGDAMFENWSESFRKRGLGLPKIALKTKTIEEAALRMKSDTGVMMLPRHLKEASIFDNIKAVDIIDEDCNLKICLVHHLENKNPIVEKFISFYLKNDHE